MSKILILSAGTSKNSHNSQLARHLSVHMSENNLDKEKIMSDIAEESPKGNESELPKIHQFSQTESDVANGKYY